MYSAQNAVSHARTKHIDIRHHFIRESIQNQVITLKYCASKEMMADIQTKALPRDQFQILRSKMGVRSCENENQVGVLEYV